MPEDFYEPVDTIGKEFVANRATQSTFAVEKNLEQYEKQRALDKQTKRAAMPRKLKFTLWLLFGVAVAVVVIIVIIFIIYSSVQIIHVKPSIVTSMAAAPSILDYPKIEDTPTHAPERRVRFEEDKNTVAIIPNKEEQKQAQVQYSDWSDIAHKKSSPGRVIIGNVSAIASPVRHGPTNQPLARSRTKKSLKRRSSAEDDTE